jgi:hypothetical protein
MIRAIARLFATRLPPCQHVVPLLARELDEPLPPIRWLQVRLHLALCEVCTRYRRHLQWLREAMRAVAEAPLTAGPSLSPEARARLTRALRDAA